MAGRFTGGDGAPGGWGRGPWGFGAAQLGNLNRTTTDEASQQAVDAAWHAGVRYFDTAPHYGLGLSERRLGAALRGRPRDAYLLSTKVGRALDPWPGGAGRTDDAGFVVPATSRRRWDFSRDGVLRQLEASLARLGTDRVDVVYLHDPDDHWPEASTTGVQALVELRDQGVVRAIGAGMNQWRMLERFVRRCDVDVVMVAGRLSVLDRTALDVLVPACRERGVAVVAAGVYNSGLLARADVPDAANFDYGPAPAALVARARAMAEVCRAHGTTLPAAAVQYPLQVPGVATVVVGCRTAAHVADTAARVAEPLPVALWPDLTPHALTARPLTPHALPPDAGPAGPEETR